ncbi:isoprenoid synthase domain-containing protein [Chaetomium sp. MPI-CAGE-AT-0009]|nr:isoprenoid synthase domain-containing protein [Chaetomium sp. MPI-CAGE-AT-0009]
MEHYQATVVGVPQLNPHPPSTYDTTLDGLAPSNLPLRVSRHPSLADRGAFRAQRDWQHARGGGALPSLSSAYTGTAGPEYNAVAVWLPETLPDRVELVAYLVELALLVDDVVDDAESPAAAAAPYMADILHAWEVVGEGGEGDEWVGASQVGKLFLGAARAMLAVDPGRARDAFRWAKVWMRALMSRRAGEREVRDLDEYLEWRRTNLASQAVFGLGLFALGLVIPEDQQQTCLELSESFWLQFSLTNDCHSWDRERKAASDSGQKSVTNAIWVLMNKQGMSCDEAKDACREKARQYAAEYVQVVEAAKTRDDLCNDAKRLLDMMKLEMSGNIVWGLQCPRYRADRQLAAAQLEMVEAIRAERTIGWDCDQEKKATHGIAEHPKVGINGCIANCAAPDEVINGISNYMTEVVQDVPALSTNVLEAPSRYVDSLPGKGIRDKTINALNVWYQVPSQQIAIISKVIDLLHGASLMLDDIEDSSQMRRGKPAAHTVFGTMQTINSAGYRFLEALAEVRKLDSQRCMDVFCQELQNLYVGQSHDLAWTCNLSCPTQKEYLAMVDGKTAGLFRMLALMLDAKSDSPTKPDVAVLTRFMTLLGRLFQIRDDYMNLTSADYTKQKGFCEDLDEGKYSLPLIQALGRRGDAGSSNGDTTVLQNLLSQRHIQGKMALNHKHLFLRKLEETGSLDYTRRALGALQLELRSLAEQMGMHKDKNLTELLETLKV